MRGVRWFCVLKIFLSCEGNGLPMYIGRSRAQCFRYLKERIWARIQGWKERFLSKAGKEIKAVAQDISTYAMSCFDLAKGLCDGIDSMIFRCWWEQEDNEHRMHWVGWEKMTQAKEHGRLGFRDLHSFNLAILPHQAWPLLQAPGSPWELFGEWAGRKTSKFGRIRGFCGPSRNLRLFKAITS